jgi:hypothetical protein
MSALPLDYFAGWLATGRRGLSSEAIVFRLTGERVDRRVGAPPVWSGKDHPHDPDDFRRCQLLLRDCPLAAASFHLMRDVSPSWARLVDAWHQIHATLEAETPGYLDDPRGRSAPNGYRLMKQILNAEVAA